MREKLPDRRPHWTASVKLDGHRVYLAVGEYEDGRPGEIFIDMNKQGTFTRGILDALARMTSVAMQCQAPLPDIVNALKGLNFPPAGAVSGSTCVSNALSVTDWVARELEATYLPLAPEPAASGVPPKVAGYASEEWRVGV